MGDEGYTYQPQKGVGMHNIYGTFVEARGVGYEPETIYKAVVNTNKSVYGIFFLSSDSHLTGRCISIGESIYKGHEWDVYHIGTATEVHHVTNDGTWVLSFHLGCSPTWIFIQNDGYKYNPTISLAAVGAGEYKTIVEDVKADKKYKKTKKEVKGKMYLQLIDVTIFNRKTKHVDFHEDIIAENNDEAYLLAVQAFGKYDPKVHVKAAKCILGFNEIGDEAEE